MMLVNVKTSSVINASIAQVWTKVRDFNDLPDWYPSVIDSHIENGALSNQIGCIRNFKRDDGLYFRERLLALDDREHLCTYSLLESNTPMKDYFCSIKLLPITDGDRTYIEWIAEFKCIPEKAQELQQSLETVFQIGFDALNSCFS
ncbi:MAG: SRPBCC family protein [Xenococcaceae cyanobacterium MO_167.B52]|nr:SRPBCC family protein [Xenococcaceae cyanobacterium MO_167.B52]